MTRRDSYTQFPRSPLGTPGTINPLLARARQTKTQQQQNGFHFLSLAAKASQTNQSLSLLIATFRCFPETKIFFRFICNCLNCNNQCNDHIVFLKFETIVLICSATGNKVRFFDYCYICIEFKALRLLWKHSISSCGIEASKVELLIKIQLLTYRMTFQMPHVENQKIGTALINEATEIRKEF